MKEDETRRPGEGKKLSPKEIAEIDRREYPEHPKGEHVNAPDPGGEERGKAPPTRKPGGQLM